MPRMPQAGYEAASMELRAEAETRDAAQREIQALQHALKEEVRAFESEFERRMAEASEQVSAPSRLEMLDRHAVQSESEALLLHLGSAEGHHGTLSINQERQLKHKSTKVRRNAARPSSDGMSWSGGKAAPPRHSQANSQAHDVLWPGPRPCSDPVRRRCGRLRSVKWKWQSSARRWSSSRMPSPPSRRERPFGRSTRWWPPLPRRRTRRTLW